MSRNFPLAALLVAGLFSVASPLAAVSEGNYGKIENKSKKDCIFTITDMVKTVGNVYIKEAGAKGEGEKLGNIGDKTVLKGGTDYSLCFDTTMAVLGLTFTLDNGDEATKINIKSAPMVGDVMIVYPKKNLKDSNIIMNFKGYNTSGEAAFITIN